MRLLTVVLVALLTTGCATEQEIAAADSARCESFGFKPESESFAQCRLALYTARYRRLDASYYGYYGYGPGYYRSPYYW